MLSIFIYPPLPTPSASSSPARRESSPFAWTTTIVPSLSLWFYSCFAIECSPQGSRSDLFKNMNYVTDLLTLFSHHSWNKILIWLKAPTSFGPSLSLGLDPPLSPQPCPTILPHCTDYIGFLAVLGAVKFASASGLLHLQFFLPGVFSSLILPWSAPTRPSKLSFNLISLRDYLRPLYLNLKWSTAAFLLFSLYHLPCSVIMLSVLLTSVLSFSPIRL